MLCHYAALPKFVLSDFFAEVLDFCSRWILFSLDLVDLLAPFVTEDPMALKNNDLYIIVKYA